MQCLFLFLGLFLFARGDESTDSGGDKVLYSTVNSLQFSSTNFASSRRGPSLPELKCIGGSASGFAWHPDWYPRVVSCVRYGGGDGGGDGAEWRCSANIRKFLTLGETRVICERYGEDARYILAGSCRLEYRINFMQVQARFVHVIYGSCIATVLFLVYGLVRFRSMTVFSKSNRPSY